MPERPTGDDAFDRIVEGLDMNLSFPEPKIGSSGGPRDPEMLDLDDLPDDPQDQFYRRVPPVSEVIPHTWRALLAWLAVLGAPLGLVAFAVFGIYLDRAMMLAMCLIFVAGAFWLFSHLPERGPGHPDWPDDGAEL